jgi:hypothetical protein
VRLDGDARIAPKRSPLTEATLLNLSKFKALGDDLSGVFSDDTGSDSFGEFVLARASGDPKDDLRTFLLGVFRCAGILSGLGDAVSILGILFKYVRKVNFWRLDSCPTSNKGKGS